MALRWVPFCGDISCPCMEPNVQGPCEEYKQTVIQRCAECGWPEARHA